MFKKMLHVEDFIEVYCLSNNKTPRGMAEREGFEPSVRLPAHVISNHAPSATRSPLRCRIVLKYKNFPANDFT